MKKNLLIDFASSRKSSKTFKALKKNCSNRFSSPTVVGKVCQGLFVDALQEKGATTLFFYLSVFPFNVGGVTYTAQLLNSLAKVLWVFCRYRGKFEQNKTSNTTKSVPLVVEANGQNLKDLFRYLQRKKSCLGMVCAP